MQPTARSAGTTGVLAGLAAYLCWGLAPLFWKQLGEVPAFDLTAWRVLWTFVLMAMVLTVMGKRSEARSVLANPRARLAVVASGILLGANWATFVWAVNDGRIVESSLGYFINPLVSVFMGVFLLGEKLRTAQWTAVGLAIIGVIWLTIDLGTLPWVALTLAFTFAFYGLIRKLAAVGPLVGIGLESAVLLVPAAVLLFIGTGDAGRQLTWSPGTTLLIVLTGVVTATPLVLFATAAQRIPLSLVGLLQYLAPSLQFLIGWQIYNEPFLRGQFVGYAIIWLGLIIFAIDGARMARS